MLCAQTGPTSDICIMRSVVTACLFLLINVTAVNAGYIYKDRHTIHADAFCAGMLYSVNYDYVLETPVWVHLSAGIGISAFGSEKSASNGGLTYKSYLPIHVSALIGKKNNFFEIGYYYIKEHHGSGYPYINYDISHENIHFMFCGYRYQNPKIGLFIRPYILPMKMYMADNGTSFLRDPPLLYKNIDSQSKKLIIYPGLSIGYTFKQRSLEERAAQKEYRILKRASKKV